jgi:transcriptional regulator with XRE-family HTH domain
LHHLCLLRGFNQSKLAARLGGIVSDSTVGNWFVGKTIPSLPVALQLARILGVPLEYLADDSMTGLPTIANDVDGAGRIAIDLIRALGLTKEEVIRRLAMPADQTADRMTGEFASLHNRLDHFDEHLISMKAMQLKAMQRMAIEASRPAPPHQPGSLETLRPPQATRAAKSFSSKLSSSLDRPYWLEIHQMDDKSWMAYVVDIDGGTVSRLVAAPDTFQALHILILERPDLFPNIPVNLTIEQLKEWLISHPLQLAFNSQDDATLVAKPT